MITRKKLEVIIAIIFVTAIAALFFPKKYKVYSLIHPNGALIEYQCECFGFTGDGGRYYMVTGSITEVCYGMVYSCSE
ncbi:MAG: hypothetical protein ACPGO5_02940 [Patescibacteria group bacterium]